MRKPSEKSMISQICCRSGTMTTTGLKRALTDSGSSVRPAYPGFMSMPSPQLVTTQSRPKALARSLVDSVLPVPAGPAGAPPSSIAIIHSSTLPSTGTGFFSSITSPSADTMAPATEGSLLPRMLSSSSSEMKKKRGNAFRLESRSSRRGRDSLNSFMRPSRKKATGNPRTSLGSFLKRLMNPSTPSCSSWMFKSAHNV
ncbi:hypothetical protein EYF80_036881 [Liparis tanakae]|uniref:Uncharacterized protein n=1 Tax=Liparis tanakae TaxID=230148 RepID=A0A4Z2GJ88_9TELE|nr:hypothetical protein EYF80_036881 [Liparis tanakae]